jgi:hypothetical protein
MAQKHIRKHCKKNWSKRQNHPARGTRHHLAHRILKGSGKKHEQDAQPPVSESQKTANTNEEKEKALYHV